MILFHHTTSRHAQPGELLRKPTSGSLQGHFDGEDDYNSMSERMFQFINSVISTSNLFFT